MEKTYFVQRKTMSGIADEVRELSGKGTMLNPEQMTTELDSANEAVDDQADVINEIREILANKRIPEEGLEGTDEYVDFYDYDGTLLHRFTVLEIQGMTELPPLPEHEGLICQGWNWTLEQLKENNAGIDVAPFYETDDGSTKLFINIPGDNMTFKLYLYSTNNKNPVYIDWGDDTIESYKGNNITVSHNYVLSGDYIIRVNSDYNYELTARNMTSGMSVNECRGMIHEIHCGNHMTFTKGYTFANTYGLKYITQCRPIAGSHCLDNSNIALVIFGESIYSHMNIVDTIVCISPNVSLVYDYAFESSINLNKIKIPRLFDAELKSYAFSKCNGDVFAPKTLKSIGNNAFDGSYFEKIVIPEGVESTPASLFNGSTVKKIILPDSLTSIDRMMCYNCKELEYIKLPKYITNISDLCFYGCSKLNHVELPQELVSIGSSAFYGTALATIDLPDSVTSIGNSCFSNSKIKYIKIPNNVTKITRCFDSCLYLEEVILPESLESIDAYTFYRCDRLTHLKIPKNVLSIANGNDYAYGMQVADFSEHEAVPTLSSSSLFNSWCKYYVPAVLYDEWITATNWSAIASRIVPV